MLDFDTVKLICKELAKPHGFAVKNAISDDYDLEIGEQAVKIVADNEYAIVMNMSDGYWAYTVVDDCFPEGSSSAPRGHANPRRVVEWAMKSLLNWAKEDDNDF